MARIIFLWDGATLENLVKTVDSPRKVNTEQTRSHNAVDTFRSARDAPRDPRPTPSSAAGKWDPSRVKAVWGHPGAGRGGRKGRV